MFHPTPATGSLAVLLLLLLLALASLPHSGEALRCYSCGSETTRVESCTDPYAKRVQDIIDCGGAALGCRKVNVINPDGPDFVARGCLTVSPDNTCLNISNIQGSVTQTCSCLGDLCNAAATWQRDASVAAAMLLIGAAAAAVLQR